MHAALTLPPMRVSAVTLQTRLPLYPDEPLFAYVARLAIAAGHHTLSGFIAQNIGDHVSLVGVFSGAALCSAGVRSNEARLRMQKAASWLRVSREDYDRGISTRSISISDVQYRVVTGAATCPLHGLTIG